MSLLRQRHEEENAGNSLHCDELEADAEEAGMSADTCSVVLDVFAFFLCVLRWVVLWNTCFNFMWWLIFSVPLPY